MSSTHSGPIMQQLREAAMAEYRDHIRDPMRVVADEVQKAITAFIMMPTGENLAYLNGAWARGVFWLDASKPKVGK